jgi:hypothetical protein
MDRLALIRITYTKNLSYGDVTVKSLLLRHEYCKGGLLGVWTLALLMKPYAVRKYLTHEAEA